MTTPEELLGLQGRYSFEADRNFELKIGTTSSPAALPAHAKARFAASEQPTMMKTGFTVVSDEAAVLPTASRQPQSTHTSTERFISALQRLWAIKALPLRAEIAHRLTTLRSSCLEEELLISMDSLDQFIRFLKRFPQLDMPRIAITDDGHVRATWSPEPDRHFAAEFCEGNLIKFVLFAPRGRPEVARFAGSETEERLLATMKQLGADWLRADTG